MPKYIIAFNNSPPATAGVEFGNSPSARLSRVCVCDGMNRVAACAHTHSRRGHITIHTRARVCWHAQRGRFATLYVRQATDERVSVCVCVCATYRRGASVPQDFSHTLVFGRVRRKHTHSRHTKETRAHLKRARSERIVRNGIFVSRECSRELALTLFY